MGPLNNKVAIATGASQGIGRAIAIRLGREGAAVVVNYSRGEQAANETVAAVVTAGGTAAAVRADVSKPAEVEALFAACVKAFGRPHVLVNNAGVATLQPLAEVTEAEFDRVFGLNAKGTLFCLKAAAEHMMDGGRVVNVSSSTVAFPTDGAYIYAGSKAVVKTYTEVAALELGKRGITVNSVLPGVTETPMTDRLPAGKKEPVAASSPFKRLGRPEDIADVVAFLASDDARWITGQHILVNGGAKQ